MTILMNEKRMSHYQYIQAPPGYPPLQPLPHSLQQESRFPAESRTI